MNRLNLIGMKFGKLTVKEFHSIIDGRTAWICICDCNPDKEIVVRAGNLRGSRETKSCGCLVNPQNYNSRHWKGHGEISGQRFSNIRYSAQKRNLEFSISIEYIWNLFLEQNRCCVYSNLPLKFSSKLTKDTEERTASLDRIDSSKGYIEGNVQWIHKDIQTMKMDKTDKEFRTWIKIIYENTHKS